MWFRELAKSSDRAARCHEFLAGRPRCYSNGNKVFVHGSPDELCGTFIGVNAVHDQELMRLLTALLHGHLFHGRTHAPAILRESVPGHWECLGIPGRRGNTYGLDRRRDADQRRLGWPAARWRLAGVLRAVRRRASHLPPRRVRRGSDGSKDPRQPGVGRLPRGAAARRPVSRSDPFHALHGFIAKPHPARNGCKTRPRRRYIQPVASRHRPTSATARRIRDVSLRPVPHRRQRPARRPRTWAFARDGKIDPRNRLGKLYLATVLLGSVTALGFIPTKGFTPGQILTLATFATPGRRDAHAAGHAAAPRATCRPPA